MARIFYLIFAWELLLNTYRGLGCAQFEWTIFLIRRWLLQRGAHADTVMGNNNVAPVHSEVRDHVTQSLQPSTPNIGYVCLRILFS